jgi:hypothetical protein
MRPALAAAHRSPLVPVARALVSVHQQTGTKDPINFGSKYLRTNGLKWKTFFTSVSMHASHQSSSLWCLVKRLSTNSRVPKPRGPASRHTKLCKVKATSKYCSCNLMLKEQKSPQHNRTVVFMLSKQKRSSFIVGA